MTDLVLFDFDSALLDEDATTALARKEGLAGGAEPVLYPDVPQALLALRERCAAAALSRNPAAQQLLERTGISHLIDGVFLVKGRSGPTRAGFQRALAALGSAPSGAVYVCASSAGLQAAQSAGLRVLWVNRSGGPPPEGAQAIASLEDLPEALDA